MPEVSEVYLIAHRKRQTENWYEWSLTMFASQEAQAIVAHSGAGMHPYPARQPN